MIYLGEILIQREKMIMERSKWEMPEMEEKKRKSCIQCGLWTLYKTTGSDSGRRAGDVGQLQSVAVEVSGADETS